MYPCTSLLYRCRWEGKITDCKDLFQISETYQGYCCSFNIKKPKKAVSNSAKKENPRKTQFSGPDRGLSVILKPLIEKNSMATVNSEGIKILINEFDLFPSEKTIERMLPLQQETFVEIRPVTTISSKAISALPISDRGCVFEEEYQLRLVFFKHPVNFSQHQVNFSRHPVNFSQHPVEKLKININFPEFSRNTKSEIAKLSAQCKKPTSSVNVSLISTTTLKT